MLNPLMLLGLAGLAVPVIIHLIQRQRLRPQWLATLQFLEREDVANAFAPVPRDRLQLLLRLLLLLLLVLLMARLAVGGREPGPRTLTVILDQSLSMQQTSAAGGTVFAAHQAAILELIDSLGPRDQMSLLLVGDTVVQQTGFSADRERLRRTVRAWEPADGGGLALAGAVRAAVRQLRNRHEVNTAVLLFSDHQAVNHLAELGNGEAGGSEFAAELSRGRVRLLLVEPGRAAADNVAVTEGLFQPPRAYLGGSARLTARVRNYAAEERACRLTFYEQEQAGESREVMLAPGEEATVDLVQRFESPVDVPCRVEIGADQLAGDNRFRLPMRMRERCQVLLVGQAPADAEDERGETRYDGIDLLAYALNPGEALGQGGGTHIAVRRVTPAVFARVSLPIYSLVVLYGAPELPEPSSRDLEAYVQAGGGLWLIPDEATAPARFNEALRPLLSGFVLGQLRQADPVLALDTGEATLGVPLFLPLLRGEWGDLRDVHVREYFGVGAPGPARTALAAANGEALALFLPVGRGRVLLQLFPFSLGAGTLPRSQAFVPLVQEVAAAIGRPDDETPGDSLRVGETRRVSVPEFRGLPGDLEAAGPERRTFALLAPERDAVQADGFTRAGDYELTHPARRSGRRRWLSVNPPAGESDLRPLDATEQERLYGTRNVRRLAATDLADAFARRRELSGPFLVLLLAAFAAEALSGAWLSRTSRRVRELQGGPRL
jgi:hypothetical protein